MEDFNGIVLSIGDLDIQFHISVIVWLVICLLVGIIMVYFGKKFEKADASVAPKGSLLVVEAAIRLVMWIVENSLGKHTRKYLPLYGTLIILMLISNLSGLLGFQPPTSNLSVNFTIAVAMFLIIQGNAIRVKGLKNRLKELTEPIWFLTPLNVIGDAVLPLSLSLRLFGNMLAGIIISTLVYSLFGLLNSVFMGLGISLFVFTPFVHMYFDIFSGCIQTYIFFTLSTYFLGQTYPEED